MENKLNINELIKIQQLPQIFSELEKIGKWVDDGLAKLDLDNIVADDNHKQELKKTRTDINNISKIMETKRKEIKSKILGPYELFNTKYEEEVANKLDMASAKLSNAINEIETKQKSEKEEMLRQFFNNYVENYHIEDIVKFEDMNLNITLSASEKSLKDQILVFTKKISDDFQAISSCDNREEILLEYQQNGFNYSQAVNTINSKLEEIKKMQEKLAMQEEIKKQEEKVVQKVQNVIHDANTLVSAPIEKKEENIVTVQFTITAPIEKVKKLKEYLKIEGIKYE